MGLRHVNTTSHNNDLTMTDRQHHHLDRATQQRKVGEGAMDEDMDGEHHQHHHLRRC